MLQEMPPDESVRRASGRVDSLGKPEAQSIQESSCSSIYAGDMIALRENRCITIAFDAAIFVGLPT
jgi:hypothetical protein